MTVAPANGKKGLICEIMLTGGPAGGKSFALPLLRQILGSRGFRTLVCPEMATMLYSNGIDDVSRLASEQRETYRQMQRTIAALQRGIRDQLRELANCFQEPVIILYDRGELDCAAYLSEEEFEKNLQELDLTREELLHSYDAVIHLRSAAATPFGDLSNNASRREVDPVEALAACDRTYAAWSGHPHHYRIDASVSFDVKLSQIYGVIAETIERCSYNIEG